MRGIYNYMIATIVGVMAMATPITSHAADATTTAAACWQEGITAYENRQYGEAVEAFEKIVALGEDRAQEKIAAAQAIYTELGIKEKAEKEIDKYYKQAIGKIEQLNLPQEQYEALVQFAKKMTFRDK